MMSGSDIIIKTSSLTKFYGKRLGIEDVNLEVKRGEVFGYLGPNGAGKTTTIRTLLDFIRPTRGSANIFGLDTRQNSIEIHRRIGYLQGDLELYGNLTGEDLLKYLGNLRGGLDWKYLRELAARFECDLSRRIKGLSHGNKQKLGLLQAFMHKPELIILDEPTNGLDPLMQHEFYRLLDETKKEGRTIFLSSHILPEVEKVCDRVGIIRQGKLVTVETIEALKAHALRQLEIHFARVVPKDKFVGIPGVRDVLVQDNMLTCNVIGSLDALVKVAAQFEVVNIVSHEATLEEIFLTYYNEGKNNVK
ncbi:MAG: ABC transporter ATP-binding protein [Dehalococcoidales bacterium]|nr:ABC transporter ATP-binding protein [Dehalococcoidales bacterium]